MSEKEQQDLVEMRRKVDRIKMDTFDFLKHVLRMDRAGLDMAGYKGKTNAEAMKDVYETAQKNVDKLQKEFLSKYPD